MNRSCKTVEFILPTRSDSASSGDIPIELGSFALALPENGKVFRSVTLEVGFLDDEGTASSPTGLAAVFQLDGEDAFLAQVMDSISSGGNATSYHLSWDLTSYFAEFWSGVARLGAVWLGVANAEGDLEHHTINHWAKLRITYEYEPASQRHIKTIWLPLESTRDLLTTSYQTVGGDRGVPAIKGGAAILPEHDVVVHQVWVEVFANQATADTTPFALDLKLSADETEATLLYKVGGTPATPAWMHAVWDITDSDLDQEQSLEAKVSGVTGRIAQMCGWVGVTYEYAPVGTTLVWNSLLLPAFDREDQDGSNDAGREAVHVAELWIQEPDAITIRASQVFAFFDTTAGSGGSVAFAAGTQPAQSFSFPAGSAPAGLGLRLDAGGSAGEGASLVRGRNRLKIRHHAGAGSELAAVSGFVLLNYTSGKAHGGVSTHNQTRHFALGHFTSGATSVTYPKEEYVRNPLDRLPEFELGIAPSTAAVALGQELFFINAVASQLHWMSAGADRHAVCVQAQRTASEGQTADGAGWVTAYRSAISSGDGGWLRWSTADCTSLFRRWAHDPDLALLNLEAPRRWSVLDPTGMWVGGLGLLVTYHGITFSARGTVTGLTADTPAAHVTLSRASTGEKLLEVLADDAGAYAAPWYDDTELLVAEVLVEGNLVGRSAPFRAGGAYLPPAEPEPDPRLHTSTHEVGGIDEINVTGLSGVLAEPQVALNHSSSHGAGGPDPIKLDDLATPDDNTDLDASTARHGLLRKLSGGTTVYLRGDGTWSEVPDASTSAKGIVQLATSAQTTAGLGVQASDTRLSNARTPTSHAGTHYLAGSDPLDITQLGLGYPGSASVYLRGNRTFAALPSATTAAEGIVELATNGETLASRAVQGNDGRVRGLGQAHFSIRGCIGVGTTNTNILRFDTADGSILNNDGSPDLSYFNSVQNGSYWRIDNPGTYSVSCSVRFGNADMIAIKAAVIGGGLSNTFDDDRIKVVAQSVQGFIGWFATAAATFECPSGTRLWIAAGIGTLIDNTARNVNRCTVTRVR